MKDRYLTYPSDMEEEYALMKETLKEIEALEEKFTDPHPEYLLLKACVLAKETLKKLGDRH